MGHSPMSPLSECVVVATTLGRSLAHKERSKEEQGRADVTPDFQRRHQWLGNILETRIRSLSSLMKSATTNELEPTLIFATLLAHANVLFLHAILKSVTSTTAKSVALLADSRNRVAFSVKEICDLAAKIEQIDHIQVSNFTSND